MTFFTSNRFSSPRVLLLSLVASSSLFGACADDIAMEDRQGPVGGKADEFLTCAEIQGSCIPVDTLEFWDCGDTGKISAPEAACEDNEFFGAMTCCVVQEPQPEPEPATCESVGGSCLGSPFFPTSGANCESDFNLVTSDASCPFPFEQTCCVAPEPEPEPEPVTCESVGGSCLGSPFFPTSGANCESDFNLATSDASCPFPFEQTCCVAPVEAD